MITVDTCANSLLIMKDVESLIIVK